jgi:hypothetical protein
MGTGIDASVWAQRELVRRYYETTAKEVQDLDLETLADLYLEARRRAPHIWVGVLTSEAHREDLMRDLKGGDR